jgi:hypothetical protein
MRTDDALGRLERASVAEVHQRRDPAEGQEREERGRCQGCEGRIVERGRCGRRWRPTSTQEAVVPAASAGWLGWLVGRRLAAGAVVEVLEPPETT